MTTPDLLSIREASELLGVSQLRVRELIKKGRLQAEKIVDGAGERWTIITASAHAFLNDRPPAETNGSAARPASAPASKSVGLVDDLVAGLEKQLGRVKALVDELSRAQSYLDGLRKAQSAIEAELKSLRPAPAPAPKPAPVAAVPPPAMPPAPVESAPVESTPEPKAEPAPKAEKPTAPAAAKKKSAGTADLSKALQDAGVESPASSKPSRAKQQKSK